LKRQRQGMTVLAFKRPRRARSSEPSHQPWPSAALWAAPALLGVALILAAIATRPSDAETPAGKAAPTSVAGTVSVIDGDTLEIHGQRIRFIGVAAPEHGQKCLGAGARFERCGATSDKALAAWLNSNPVSCAIEGTDRYGRFLGKCSVRGADTQDWLARNSYAIAYREYIDPSQWRKGARLLGEAATKAMKDGRIASR
jgi:endonuclease YncB( thermonuclease family)